MTMYKYTQGENLNGYRKELFLTKKELILAQWYKVNKIKIK